LPLKLNYIIVLELTLLCEITINYDFMHDNFLVSFSFSFTSSNNNSNSNNYSQEMECGNLMKRSQDSLWPLKITIHDELENVCFCGSFCFWSKPQKHDVW